MDDETKILLIAFLVSLAVLLFGVGMCYVGGIEKEEVPLKDGKGMINEIIR